MSNFLNECLKIMDVLFRCRESKFSEVGTNIFGMLVDKALKLKSIDEVMEIVRKIHSLTKASPSVSALQKIATELSNADPKRIHEIKYLIKQVCCF